MPPPTPDCTMPAWVLPTLQILANVAVIATAGFIFWQVKRALAVHEIRKVRALEFVARWNDHGFCQRRTWLIFHLEDKSQSYVEKMKYIRDENHPERLIELTDYMNFLEEFSIGVNLSLVDEEISRRFFQSILVRCHTGLEEFLTEVRKEKPHGLLEFTSLITRWSSLPPLSI